MAKVVIKNLKNKDMAQEEPVKIVVSPTSIVEEKFVQGTNIYIDLYKECAVMSHRGEYESIEENNAVPTVAYVDDRRVVSKYAISGIFRVYDSYNDIYLIDIGGMIKFNVKNRKRADNIFNTLSAWRFSV